MKNLSYFLLLFLTALAADAQSVPQLVNYQGRLSNPNGTALDTADYQLTFSIWDTNTGGTLIWGPQIFDIANGVPSLGHGLRIPVVQGYFNVMLGPADTNGTSLASAFTNATSFVQITVGTNQPILPRQRIVTAPYAFQAGNSATLAGADWSAVFGTNDPVNGTIPTSKLATNGAIVTQQLSLGTTNKQGKLDVNGDMAIENGHELQLNSLDNTVASRIKNPAASTREISFVTGAPLTEAMRITQGGNVGIGEPNPLELLHVLGTNPRFRVDGHSDNDSVGFTMYHSPTNNDQIWSLTMMGASPIPGSANRDLVVNDGSAFNYLTIRSGGPVLLQPNSGNVGIGKTNPATALDVNGTVTAVNFTGSGAGLSGLNLSNMTVRQVSSVAGAGGLALSTNSGDFQTTSGTDAVVPNLQITLTCVGGPVEIFTLGAGSGLNSFFENNNGAGASSCIISLYRDGTRLVSEWFSGSSINASTAVSGDMPASAFRFIDTPLAGNHTYDLRLRTGGGYARVLNVRLAAREF